MGHYTVWARNGYEFEEEFLGKEKSDTYKSTNSTIDFDDAMSEVLDPERASGFYPDTPMACLLYCIVDQHLILNEIPVQELRLERAVGTLADSRFQSDAVFYLLTKSGEHFVATIDLFFISRKFVRRLKKTQEKNGRFLSYSELQDRLFWMKKINFNERFLPSLNGRISQVSVLHERPPNYFTLTPHDLEKWSELEKLGEEIAHSLIDQVRRQEGS